MAKKVEKVNKIAKEKRPFDKTYIPLTIAFIILFILVVALLITIFKRPKDKPTSIINNTANIEEVVLPKEDTTCSSEELKALSDSAKKITARFEEIDDFVFGTGVNQDSIEEEEVTITGYALRMTLENIEPGYYIMISNDLDAQLDTIYDFNGDTSYSWDEGDTAYIRKYTINVYSYTDTCKHTPLRSFEFSVPKWNEVSKLGACASEDWKHSVYCQHFTFDKSSFSGYLKKFEIERQKVYKQRVKENSNENIEENKMVSFVKKNLIVILIVMIGVVVAVIAVILVMKGRKNNEE